MGIASDFFQIHPLTSSCLAQSQIYRPSTTHTSQQPGHARRRQPFPSHVPQHITSAVLLRVVHHISLTQHQRPHNPTSNIDPTLLGRASELAGAPMSLPKPNPCQIGGGSSSESESSSEQDSCSDQADSNSSDEDGDEMPDVGWAATGKARKTHPGMHLSGLECLLTPF